MSTVAIYRVLPACSDLWLVDAVQGNFSLSTFPEDGVDVASDMWNFWNLTDLPITVPRLQVM